MVMFEGNSAGTVAMATTPEAESAGAASSNAASVSIGERLRAAKSRMKRSTTSAPRVQGEWVAAGDEHYPPMVMFEGLSTDTIASAAPEAVASTTSDTLENTSTETNENIGGTTEAPSEAVGVVRPPEPPADPGRTTGTDMHSGKEDKITGTNPETPDLASDNVNTEGYVASWTPSTSAEWDVYTINHEVESVTPAPSADVEQLITMYDMLLPQSDSPAAPEPTAVHGLTNEGSPG